MIFHPSKTLAATAMCAQATQEARTTVFLRVVLVLRKRYNNTVGALVEARLVLASHIRETTSQVPYLMFKVNHTTQL